MKIRVSSTVLKNASPKFDAMLKPQFIEGQQLASNGFLEHSLLEDDGGTMVAICQVIHGSDGPPLKELLPDALVYIAKLADKHDFIEALRSTAESWIEKKNQRSTTLVRCKLLIAAFLFRLSDLFSDISRSILLRASGDIYAPDTFKDLEIGPAVLVEEIFCEAISFF